MFSSLNNTKFATFWEKKGQFFDIKNVKKNPGHDRRNKTKEDHKFITHNVFKMEIYLTPYKNSLLLNTT